MEEDVKMQQMVVNEVVKDGQGELLLTNVPEYILVDDLTGTELDPELVT